MLLFNFLVSIKEFNVDLYNIHIYSVTYKVNLFGKAFAHVRNCLQKEKHMYGTNQNIDRFYTKTTQIWGFRVKIKKKSVLYSIFQHVYSKNNLVFFFTAKSYFDSRIASSFFILFFFFSGENARWYLF